MSLRILEVSVAFFTLFGAPKIIWGSSNDLRTCTYKFLDFNVCIHNFESLTWPLNSYISPAVLQSNPKSHACGYGLTLVLSWKKNFHPCILSWIALHFDGNLCQFTWIFCVRECVGGESSYGCGNRIFLARLCKHTKKIEPRDLRLNLIDF